MDDIDPRLNFECLDPQVRRIIECLKKTNRITDAVIECLDKCSDSTKKDILFCLLLNELERNLSCATDSVLTCGEGIDGVARTVRTDVNNVLATLPSASTQSQIGRLFNANITTFLRTSTPAGSIVITNPAGSGRIMYVDSVLGGSRVSAFSVPLVNLTAAQPIVITILRDSPPGEAGADLDNLNYGFPANSAMSATGAASSSDGNIVAIVTQTFGTLINLDFSGKIIVPPGHSFAVDARLTGVLEPSTAIIEFTFNVIWYELDIPA